MTIYKELVDQIIKQYSATLGDLIGDKGLDITGGMQSVDELPDQLDKIFYTLEFLKNEGLIKITETQSTTRPDIFQLPLGSNVEKIPGFIFYSKKAKEQYDWQVEMQPGLIHFKQQGYQTDDQLKERRQFWYAVAVALVAATVTAILTAWLTKPAVLTCWGHRL